MMKKTLIFAALVTMLFSCGSKITGDDPDKGKEPEELTDAEKFNSVLLKKDIEKVAGGSVLEEIVHDPLCMFLKFSDGTSLLMGKRYGALVDSDANGFVTVNGKKQDWRVADVPYYTLTEKGEWLRQGEPSGKTVVNSAPRDVAETYVSFAENGPRQLLFHFSDGTSLSFPYPRKTAMYVKKSEKQMDVYIGEEGSAEYIQYPFKKRFSEFKPGVYKCYLDNWGIMALRLAGYKDGKFDSGTEIFLNGEAEMAVSVTDGSDPTKNNYVGGVLHGFENIIEKDGARGLTITVDGVAVPEDGSFELKKASKIVMTQSSELCQAYTDTNPFARAERVWTFEDGRLTIKIDLTILRDIHFANGMFGMMCVLRRWKESTSENYLTSVAVKSNQPLKGIDVKDGWGSMSRDHATTWIREYGEKGWSFALCVDESNIKPNGGMFVGTNGNGYNKIYFDLTGSYDAKAGEVLSGKVHWEIERYY